MSENKAVIPPEARHDLIMLYVELHSTSETTPEQLCDLYRFAKAQIDEYGKGNGKGRAGC